MSAQPQQPELPLDAATLFPRMRSERAEFYLAQIRQTLRLPLPGSREANLWDEQMDESDRLFLCRIAKIDRSASTLQWFRLSYNERVLLVSAITRLREWVLSFHMPLDPYRERAFEHTTK